MTATETTYLDQGGGIMIYYYPKLPKVVNVRLKMNAHHANHKINRKIPTYGEFLWLLRLPKEKSIACQLITQKNLENAYYSKKLFLASLI